MVINKTSCLTTAFLENFASVLGRVSCLVFYPCHMSGRATRKCKETAQQVKQRLTREQANRTKKRVKEILDLREDDSDSDSEDDKDNSSEEDSDSLSLLRRDLYLGLLCLFILRGLQSYCTGATSCTSL
jgi:hypothetical protein